MKGNQVTLYNQELDIEFYHIPKNGMTSVIRGIKGFKWVPIDHIKPTTKKVCIIRDPVKRIVSAFEHFVFYENASPYTKEQSLRRITESEIEKLGGRNNKQSYFSPQGFKSFLGIIKNGGYFNRHHLKQIDYLDGSTGPLASNPRISHRRIDNIDHFYPLGDLVQTFKSNHGLKLQNSSDIVMNKGLGPKPVKAKILDFARKEQIKIITELYREDFELYEKYIKK